MSRLSVLVALLALALGGADSGCQAVSRGGGAITSGSVSGASHRGGAAPAVVGIDWPEGGAYGTLELLWEAGKETAYADNDPVETPTQFGAMSEVTPTQAVLANRPTIQIPCGVGPAIACFYTDGGDRWIDGAIRSSLRFLHDGTGMTCYGIAEQSAAAVAGATIIATGSRNTGEEGFSFRSTSAATDRLGIIVNNETAIVCNRPAGGTGLEDQTWGAVISHGTSRSLDCEAAWRGASVASGELDYLAAPATVDPFAPLTIGYSAGYTVHQWIGNIFAIACYSAIHGDTEVAAVWAAVEAVTGVLPQ